MKYIKNICFILFITICLITSLYINVTAEEYPFECCTDPKFMKEANNALIQKKLNKINQEKNIWSNEISLFSSSIGNVYPTRHLMPSTGTVNVLAIPITFPDHPVSDERLKLLNDALFGLCNDKNSFNYQATTRPSVRQFFKDNSNGKLNFIGELAPIYTTSELPSYYVENDDRLKNLLKDILNYYKNENIISDWSKYDSDEDGYLDCLMLLFPRFDDLKYGPINGKQSYWSNHAQTISPITVNDTIKVSQNMVASFLPETTSVLPTTSFTHECGHLMGLPDNYSVEGSDNCLIYGTHDFMTSDGGNRYYFNPFSRYILDWIEPKILKYDEEIRTVDLCAYENSDNINAERAIIFTPVTQILPFSEFYMAEYRLNPAENNKGIIIWHINGAIKDGGFVNASNYIKPIYKNGGKEITDALNITSTRYIEPDDMYLEGDIWSSTTSPSSDFYNGFKTGAYMEVLNMDEEKATVRAGFQDMGWEQPTVSVTGGYNESINSFTGQEEKYVYFSLAYDDVYTIMGIKSKAAVPSTSTTPSYKWYLSKEVIDKYVEVTTTDNVQVQIDYDHCYVNSDQNQVYIRINDVDATENEGAVVQLHLKEGSAINGFNKCEAVTYEVQIPDLTPPTGTITYSTDENTGIVTATLEVSEDIQPIEMTHTFYRNGSYTFEFYDLAGNKGTATATVDWIERAPVTAEVEYSTTKPTNQDVVVTIKPSEEVKETVEELTHTFTENGSYTFTFHDMYGNSFEKTVTVDWIDKKVPFLSTYYSTITTSSYKMKTKLKGPYVVVVTSNKKVKPFDNKHIFDENGSYTFQAEDLLGNVCSNTVTVDCIDNDNYLGEISYSTTDWTNQDVTVTLIPRYGENAGKEITYVLTDYIYCVYTKVPDENGKNEFFTIEAPWIDKMPPQIELNGDSEITLEYGSEYAEQGAIVTDRNILFQDRLEISGEVNTLKPGTYELRYNATDLAGNKAEEKVRTVTILEPENCLVKFVNYNGDILQSSDVAYGAMPEYTGETPVKPSDDKYTYTFSGWTPTVKVVSSEAEYTAQYTAIPRVYNITLNAKGGTVENSVTEYTYGTGATLPVPSKTGYTFNGWYDDETCSGAAITEISATDTGDKAYYAKWTPNIYTVTYDYNEATGGNSVKTKTVVYDSEYGTLPTPSKIGCIFDGWNTSDNVKVTSETIVSIAENHTLRAQWADCPHTWDSGKITKNATCTETGTALFTCTICADTKTEEIAMLSHTEVTDLRVEPTCTENGKTEGSHCSVCNTVIKAQEVISATGHDFNGSDWTITVNPSESVTGIAERTCKNDNSHKDTVTLPVLTDTSVWTKTIKAEPSESSDGLMEYTSQYGTVTVVIPATGHTHDWGDWKIIHNPTTEAAGTAERTCIKNNAHKETITVPNLSDTIWSKGSYLAPTCTENGSQEYISNDYGSVTVIIEATGHTVVTDEAVASTCEATGKTEGSHCSVCNTVITEQQEIAAIGHDWSDWSISKEPSETEAGEAEKYCKNDNSHSISIELPNLLDNTVWELKENREPTEEAEGYKKYISDYGTVTITIPSIELSDRVNFTNLNNGYILAEIIFNNTQPPESNNIQMFVAFKKDNVLQGVQIPQLTGFNAIFDIPEKYMDCEVSVFVWDKNMKPLMGVQKIDL